MEAKTSISIARRDTDEKFNVGRLILFFAALSIVSLILWRYHFSSEKNYTNIPQEVQIKYVPADFRADIDYDNALPILANPYRYSQEFDQLIRDFNLSLLRHVANRMDLSDSLKARLVTVYETHHPYLRRMMFNDFLALQDTSAALYNIWYKNHASNAVGVFHEVASKYTCFLINQVFATLLPTIEGKIYVKGENVDTPCGVAIREGLQPMMARLKEKAAIEDFNAARGILQERVERTIAELGTMEIRDRKGISASRQTKVLGVDVSSTEMEISAISILKVGFKLDKFLDINVNSKSGIVTVTLPEPEILSHEVYPRIDKLSVGWLREVDQTDFNKNMDLLRREFRNEAIEGNVLEKARQRAVELMDTILTPIVKSMNPQYQIKIRFRKIEPIKDLVKESEPFGELPSGKGIR